MYQLVVAVDGVPNEKVDELGLVEVWDLRTGSHSHISHRGLDHVADERVEEGMARAAKLRDGQRRIVLLGPWRHGDRLVEGEPLVGGAIFRVAPASRDRATRVSGLRVTRRVPSSLGCTTPPAYSTASLKNRSR